MSSVETHTMLLMFSVPNRKAAHPCETYERFDVSETFGIRPSRVSGVDRVTKSVLSAFMDRLDTRVHPEPPARTPAAAAPPFVQPLSESCDSDGWMTYRPSNAQLHGQPAFYIGSPRLAGEKS